MTKTILFLKGLMSPRKNRVGRSIKSLLIGSWKGRKNFKVGIFFIKNLLG